VALLPLLLLAFVAGAGLPVQAGVNATLAGYLGSPLRASLVSFVVGVAALVIIVALFARGSTSSAKLSEAPWWVWIGGFFGVIYVITAAVAAPRIGAVALLAFALAGQTVASVVLDSFGWVGFEHQGLNPGRLAGIALLAIGVTLVRVF